MKGVSERKRKNIKDTIIPVLADIRGYRSIQKTESISVPDTSITETAQKKKRRLRRFFR